MEMSKLKKLLKVSIIYCILISITIVYHANSEIVYECNRYTYDHDWWNPFDWFVDYAEVYTSLEIGYDGINTVIIESILCTGRDDLACPDCGSLLTLHPNDNILNQGFLDSSTQMMENFVISQINNSIYSGYQSFNTIYNNHNVYRNVSWSGDTTTTEINVIMHIIPASNP